jgi:hypothetical protein
MSPRRAPANWRERGSKKNAADFVIPPVQSAATCTPSGPIERLSGLPICRMAMRKKGKKVQADYDNFYFGCDFSSLRRCDDRK